MYTAKLKGKEFVGGAIKVTVEFSNGTTSVQETCIPQDANGFKFWVKSRLATFNGGAEIDASTAIEDVIDVSEVVVTLPEKTPEEIARNAWLNDYATWVKVKRDLIDTGILDGTETKVVQLKTRVQTNLLPAYIDFI